MLRGSPGAAREVGVLWELFRSYPIGVSAGVNASRTLAVFCGRPYRLATNWAQRFRAVAAIGLTVASTLLAASPTREARVEHARCGWIESGSYAFALRSH